MKLIKKGSGEQRQEQQLSGLPEPLMVTRDTLKCEGKKGQHHHISLMCFLAPFHAFSFMFSQLRNENWSWR